MHIISKRILLSVMESDVNVSKCIFLVLKYVEYFSTWCRIQTVDFVFYLNYLF